MAMQAGDLREGEPASEINTTPLIDVMLVMLVMLLITLPPQRHAVKLDTPVPCPACVIETDTEPPPPIRIAIDFDGGIYWDGELVAVAELDRHFAAAAREPDQREVHIQPHRLAKYGVVAHVMAAAQREGMKRLGMIKWPKPGY